MKEMTQKRTIKPEDLYELKSVADPQLSSNGSNLAYIETSMLEEKNTYSSNIFYINTSEKSPPVQWSMAVTKTIHRAGLQMGMRLHLFP
jgi:dipeptidyl aminopeptidase/acylaminoacyl peptidase